MPGFFDGLVLGLSGGTLIQFGWVYLRDDRPLAGFLCGALGGSCLALGFRAL